MTPATLGELLYLGTRHLQAADDGWEVQASDRAAAARQLHRMVVVMTRYVDDVTPCDEIEALSRGDLTWWQRAAVDVAAALRMAGVTLAGVTGESGLPTAPDGLPLADAAAALTLAVDLLAPVTGASGGIWFSPGNGAVGGWASVGGAQVEGNPTLVPRSGQSVIDAFIRNSAGQIVETWYNWGNGQWGGWIPIAGGSFTSDPQAVATSDGHDQIFAVNNGTIEQNWFDPGTGDIGDWVTI